MLRATLITMVALLAAAQVARAEDDCACKDEKFGDDCTGTVRQDGRWMFVSSTDKRCSRVEWTASDAPQVTMVKGGENLFEWTGQPDQPAVAVQSCKVCKKERKVEQEVDDASDDDAGGGFGEKRGGLSPFEGRWEAEGHDVFGNPVPYVLQLHVEGKRITGTLEAGHFDGDRGKANVRGTVRLMNSAVIEIDARNWGRANLKILDHRTLEMDTGFARIEMDRR